MFNLCQVTFQSYVYSYGTAFVIFSRMKSAKSAKKRKLRDNQMFEETELEIIKSLGVSLKRKETCPHKKDDDELFTDLLGSQLKQLPSERKLIVKMEINNLISNCLLKFNQSQVSQAMNCYQSCPREGNIHASYNSQQISVSSMQQRYYPSTSTAATIAVDPGPQSEQYNSGVLSYPLAISLGKISNCHSTCVI